MFLNWETAKKRFLRSSVIEWILTSTEIQIMTYLPEKNLNLFKYMQGIKQSMYKNREAWLF